MTPKKAPPPFNSAFAKVSNLVKTFQANEARYLSPDYQEAEARKDFIDKFFIALGWDVNHDAQTNPYEQEVKVEQNVSMAAGQRRADYAFHLAPNFRDVRFFVEAKKPRGDIATADNYFQTIRYGWNSETPMAVLTDFEQFHILDCRYKPDPATALNRYVAKYHYSDYSNHKKFAEIWWLFSREAVADGSLEKRAKELPKPRGKAVRRGLFPGGYQSIDESFLKELDEYRIDLAKAFKRRNPRLDSPTLTELAQRTLDRLVFLRFLEDKGIEPQRLVDNFGDKGTAWEDFIAAGRRLDGIYNGVVFKQHDILDAPNFRVEDNAFAGICGRLSHVNSPYNFDIIPIHILGSIYERFLGKVIVATDKRVRVEEKPEVRKAGGVYYTPEYIVRYIVENTVGKLIEGRTPDKIAEMRFADIACGSGSFLLAVYDLLLIYHGNYYNRNPGKARKGDCIRHDGKPYLSLGKKREILLNNIYGVDIDAQAVEVCQLSLYLKLLQDETTTSARQYMLDFEHVAKLKRLLPDLGKNIVCGNSLIGTDILDGQLFPTDEERNLNSMNFEDAFPEVMKRGGFDAVVGNPPWVRTERIDENQLLYFRTRYCAGGQVDLYLLFAAKAMELQREGGYFSFILPKFVLFNLDAEAIRKEFLKQHIITIVDVGQAFPDVNTECAILVLRKASSADEVKVSGLDPDGSVKWSAQVRQSSFRSLPNTIFNIYMTPQQAGVVQKMLACGIPLSSVLLMKRGIEIGKKAVRQRRKGVKTLLGQDVRRYCIHWEKTYTASTAANVRRLASYSLVPRKILIRRVAPDLIAVVDDGGYYFIKNLYGGINQTEMSDFYILGLINSSLLNFFSKKYYTTKKQDIFPELQKYQLEGIPILRIDLSRPHDKSRHDAIVTKVEAMLDAKKQLARAKTDKNKTYYESKCAGLDRQIDRLVYDLYGLTEDDIKIVEGGT